MSTPPRWITDTSPGHSEWYIERFRAMAADGADLVGEARFMDALAAPGSRILDAGCGPGRVGGELHQRGHHVVGVDVDPKLIGAAEQDHPGPVWLQGDLAELDLAAHPDAQRHGLAEPFDAAVIAGNVMTFVAVGTEAEVLRRVGLHVRQGGAVVVGFGMGRGYEIEAFDADIDAAGLTMESRLGTWDLRPFGSESDFAVTVLRVPD